MISAAMIATAMLSPGAEGQVIHKCVAQGSTSYQGAPCDAGSIEAATFPMVRPDTSGTQPPVSERDVDTGGADEPRSPRLPFGRTAIALGMTDDEILNIPQWGPPASIQRTRGRHLFREIWTYRARADGERQLAFTNGRLTSVDAGSAASAPIHLATVRER